MLNISLGEGLLVVILSIDDNGVFLKILQKINVYTVMQSKTFRRKLSMNLASVIR